jgi:hypothetical protein
VATKADLVPWLEEALKARDGRGTIAELCREIWQRHEPDLRTSGDLFYTWQYDVRWAAYRLRESGVLRPDAESPAGVWELATEDGEHQSTQTTNVDVATRGVELGGHEKLDAQTTVLARRHQVTPRRPPGSG